MYLCVWGQSDLYRVPEQPRLHIIRLSQTKTPSAKNQTDLFNYVLLLCAVCVSSWAHVHKHEETQWPEEEIRYPSTRITENFKLSYGCRELILGPLLEQPVLLILSPPKILLFITFSNVLLLKRTNLWEENIVFKSRDLSFSPDLDMPYMCCNPAKLQNKKALLMH